jgi:hypothetical protein
VSIARSSTLTNLLGAHRPGGRQHAARQAVDREPRPAARRVGLRRQHVAARDDRQPSDATADLHLYVFDCTSGPCNLAGQGADGGFRGVGDVFGAGEVVVVGSVGR